MIINDRMLIICDGAVRFNAASVVDSDDGMLTISEDAYAEPGTRKEIKDYNGDDDAVRIMFSDIRSVQALIDCATEVRTRMIEKDIPK